MRIAPEYQYGFLFRPPIPGLHFFFGWAEKKVAAGAIPRVNPIAIQWNCNLQIAIQI